MAVVLALSVYTELKEKRIPNALTVSGMIAGLALGYLPGGLTLGASALGLLIGFGTLFVFYVLGGMGGGDVKLMGAVGALAGFPMILSILFHTAIIGGAMALLQLVWKGSLRLRASGGPPIAKDVPPAPLTIPYGLAIAMGAVVSLFFGFS
jgi:prepilin peptidase CpaA